MYLRYDFINNSLSLSLSFSTCGMTKSTQNVQWAKGEKERFFCVCCVVYCSFFFFVLLKRDELVWWTIHSFTGRFYFSCYASPPINWQPIAYGTSFRSIISLSLFLYTNTETELFAPSSIVMEEIAKDS